MQNRVSNHQGHNLWPHFPCPRYEAWQPERNSCYLPCRVDANKQWSQIKIVHRQNEMAIHCGCRVAPAPVSGFRKVIVWFGNEEKGISEKKRGVQIRPPIWYAKLTGVWRNGKPETKVRTCLHQLITSTTRPLVFPPRYEVGRWDPVHF